MSRFSSPDDLLKSIGKQEPQPEPVPAPSAPTVYCVGFMHAAGARADKFPIKVFATDDVAAAKARFQEATPHPLKIHAAVLCINGDADTVCAAFAKLYNSVKLEKSPGWFNVSKAEVDDFVKSVTANTNFLAVSEAKAKKPKLTTPKVKKSAPTVADQIQ